MSKLKPRVPAGMRDILPAQMVKRQYVIDTIAATFEEFGFEPLQTPAIELDETLRGKYGPEAERLVYRATYGAGEEQLALRYDLSVPLCRVVAQYPDLPKPFKRYQIAPVWRADRPQRGRFREFYQCDCDSVGSSSMICDAETVAVIYHILARLGFASFTIQINNRKLLNGIGRFAGVPGPLLKELYQAIDKLPKIGVDGVRQELLAAGIPDPAIEALRRVVRLYLQKKFELGDLESRLLAESTEQGGSGFGLDLARQLIGPARALLESQSREVAADRVQEHAGKLALSLLPPLRQYFRASRDLIPESVVDGLLGLLAIAGDNRAVLAALRAKLGDYPEALEGIGELEAMFGFLDDLGVPSTHCRVDVSMARGLEYYTGPIFETVVHEAGVGSVTGGGRFDDLVGMFMDRSLPANGTTIGIERLIVVMEERNMFPPGLGNTPVQVLVAYRGESERRPATRLAGELRRAGVRTLLYPDPDPLREQIGFANRKAIPVAVVLGPDEVAAGTATVRDLRAGQQHTVTSGDLVATVRRIVE